MAAEHAADADLVVVNTCAFIEDARQESIDTILALDDARRAGSRLVVTGCLAERYGDGAGRGAARGRCGGRLRRARVADRQARPHSGAQPRPAQPAPAAAPARRGPTSRSPRAATAPAGSVPSPASGARSAAARRRRSSTEVDQLGAQEIVLVAQDLASYGKDEPGLGAGSIVPLVQAVAARVPRVRLLYLYPSDLSDDLIDAICATGVPYFDLSLQHVSKPLLRRMRRWGDGDRFLRRIDDIRRREPAAAFRSNFIVGYPGETEADHDQLLSFVDAAQLDWCGFFAYSQGGRDLRRRPRRRGARLAGRGAPGRAAVAPGRHHRRPARRPDRHRHRGARRRAGGRSEPSGGTRDRRHRPRARTTLAVGTFADGAGGRRPRPRPRRRAAAAAVAGPSRRASR